MTLKLGINIDKLVTKPIMQLKKLSALILPKTLIYIEVIWKKTWKLINDLSSRSSCNSKKVIVKEQVVTSPAEIAEPFNNYFSSVGKNLADKIPLTHHEPEVYLNPTDKRFSLKAPIVDKVYNLLHTIDEKKSTGLANCSFLDCYI